MNDTTKKTDANKDEKETKKLIESHMLVLKHKLGRAPTAEEISKVLGGEEVSADPETPVMPDNENVDTEPKVLKMKVYYGMGSKKTDKGETKEADPNKVLFYEHGDGRCFDCASGSWMDQKPSVLEHLPSRPLMFDQKNTDIIRAIANGVIDDEDFTELDKSGALNDDSKKVYSHMQKVRELSAALNKSEEGEPEDESASMVNVEEVAAVAAPIKAGVDVVKNFMDTAGVQQSLAAIEDNFGQEGADLFAEILKAALADVDEKTRMLVRQEISAYIEPIMDVVEGLAQHMGISVDLALPETENEEVPEESFEENDEDDENSEDEELTEDSDDDSIEDEE